MSRLDDATLPDETRPRILVVDDDEDTRQLIAFVLAANRYAVTEVADGNAALAALRTGSFDLVITDYDMPGMTGAEMLKRAARDGTLGSASTLVVTAHQDPPDVPEDTALLHKPLDVERLLVQVRVILSDAQVPEAAPPPEAQPLELVLYVSPRSPASLKARHKMDELLGEFDTAAVSFKVCNLFEHAASAERDRVVFTPTLVKRRPAPRAWILGDLTKDDVVRDLLVMCGVPRRDGGNDA